MEEGAGVKNCEILVAGLRSLPGAFNVIRGLNKVSQSWTKLCSESIHLNVLFKASSFDAVLCICLTLLCSVLQYSNTWNQNFAVTDSSFFSSRRQKGAEKPTDSLCSFSKPWLVSVVLLGWRGLWWPSGHGVKSSCASAVDPTGARPAETPLWAWLF